MGETHLTGHERIAAANQGDDACIRLWCGVKMEPKPDD